MKQGQRRTALVFVGAAVDVGFEPEPELAPAAPAYSRGPGITYVVWV
jgi:hypothetical protein